MTKAFLIIDGGKEGLPTAPKYYATFPQEPSPLGVLEFAPAQTFVMSDSNRSAFTLLGELAKLDAGSVAMVVCHAFVHGMLLPIANGGRSQNLDDTGIKAIETATSVNDEHTAILRMPRETDPEIKAVKERWAKLLTSIGSGVTGDFEEADAEKLFQQWFEGVAKHSLEMPDVATLLTLLARIQAVRRLKLARIELRACNVGRDKTTMELLRKFFGCVAMTAPMVQTFFGSVPVGAMVTPPIPPPPPVSRTQMSTGWSFAFGRDTGSGALMHDPASTRGFIPNTIFIIKPGPVAGRAGMVMLPRVDTVVSGGFRFVLKITSPKDFQFVTTAWASFLGSARPPAPAVVQSFAAKAFDPNTQFSGEKILKGKFLSLPIAGLWTPDSPGMPFVLPLETAYLSLIASTP